ncbi:hypothetical protein [Pseudoalteromonas ruthenica]|uniref:hypothetical protein n=1 Tax=Pseudoalteromonas ruthenica TaxID=151081 RepID=UPI00110AC2A2|nr:hypothetical protein [Pseudoalteromonas ruthenica]TMO88821.1 hypothetical protein CWC12_07315 [Pseudoalteromonas ruthenica]TMP23406.1 hypothetical protein CWC06_11155 [Pseudoalteromonas ruthenica]
MRIKSTELPREILENVLNPDPLEGEDIIIENGAGETIGVIIQPKAYDFLLRKFEELEDENDDALDEKYDPNSPSLDDLMGD